MNKHSSIKSSGSLLERAGDLYGFGKALGPIDPMPPVDAAPELPSVPAPDAPVAAPAPHRVAPAARPATALVDRELLRAGNLIVPEDPVSSLAEEFRLIKRQLLLSAVGGKGFSKLDRGERILVCSALPNEGKSFVAANLALSLASEKDNRVLLVDADVARPSIPAMLGVEPGPGLMDAIADPDADVGQYVVQTDITGLELLSAGTPNRLDTELLASARTERVLDRLTADDPSRMIIFDSPPALAASPASTLAYNVGQTLLVVKADSTTDTAISDALKLLGGCEHIQLVLNGTKFSTTGRRFGSYYGQGAE